MSLDTVGRPDGGHRILIVDDDAGIRDLLTDAFRTGPDEYVIETATDGIDCGLKLEGFAPDLVILDVNMPGMDGFEICERIRRRHELDGMRIIILTGYPQGSKAETSLFLGADLFLTKPVSIDTLLSHVTELLDEQI